LNVFNSPLDAIVSLVVALALLVVMPLALRLIEAPGLPRVARLWPVLGIPALVSMALPRGTTAAVLAGVYLMATLVLLGCAAARFWQRRGLRPLEIAALTALATPSVAAGALVAERAGYELFGFSLGILRLTAPHLHFAGCVAALVAGLTARATGRTWLSSLAALCVPVGTLLVLGGYFVGDYAELAGAVVLTTGMWLTAWLTWRLTTTATPVAPASGRAALAAAGGRAPTARGLANNRPGDRATRTLMRIGAATLAITMVLALAWALGEATGLPHPTLTWMAATHGLANAVGFALCSVLAWRGNMESPL
jgi:YndJ-like protein